MSQEATISPRSLFYEYGPDESASIFDEYAGLPAFDRDQPYRRRRTVHPHNPPMDPIYRSLEGFSESSRPNPPPPRLEHRASQTLIDLTDDNDEPVAQPPRPRTHTLPRGSRNGNLGGANVIDLTDDNDVEITRVAPRPLPPIGAATTIDRQPQLAPMRFISRREHLNRVFPEHPPEPPGFAMAYVRTGHRGLPFLEHVRLLEHAQAIVGHLQNQDDNDAPPRPNHVPPPPAKNGFTRSPTEEDVVICPSCEEELIHDKAPDELVLKKGGKAPTRKEREEHPFWVVKNCGHVSLSGPCYYVLAN